MFRQYQEERGSCHAKHAHPTQFAADTLALARHGACRKIFEPDSCAPSAAAGSRPNTTLQTKLLPEDKKMTGAPEEK